ncbi:ubiquitin-specific protease ubp2, partial [Perkinsus olseni]
MPNIPAGIDNFNYSACFSIAAAQGLRSLAPFEKRINNANSRVSGANLPLVVDSVSTFSWQQGKRAEDSRTHNRLLSIRLSSALAGFSINAVDGDDNNAPEPSGGLASTLQTLFEQMADGSKGPADIRSFFEQCKKVCPELMREPYRQHDSQ